MAGSFGQGMFNFIKHGQTFLQSGYDILHSHQQCMKFPGALHPVPTPGIVFFFFLNCHFSLGILICIFLARYNDEHLFICKLATHICSLVKCLFTSFACCFFFLNGIAFL